MASLRAHRLMASCILFGFAAAPAAGLAAGAPSGAKAQGNGKKVWFTYPQPPKVKDDDPLRVFPGNQVPEHPERYVFKVASGLDGHQQNLSSAPLFDRDGVKIGELPVGAEVKLDLFTVRAGIIYYAVPQDGGKSGWVSGRQLQAAAYTPPPRDQ